MAAVVVVGAVGVLVEWVDSVMDKDASQIHGKRGVECRALC